MRPLQLNRNALAQAYRVFLYVFVYTLNKFYYANFVNMLENRSSFIGTGWMGIPVGQETVLSIDLRVQTGKIQVVLAREPLFARGGMVWSNKVTCATFNVTFRTFG